MNRVVFFLFTFFMVACSGKPPLHNNFEDSSGTIHTAADYLENNKGLVMLFLTPECPLCQNYAVAMRKLQRQYIAQDIPFIGVISGEFYTKDAVGRYRLKYKLEMDMLFDPEFKLSKYYGATTTPEAVLIDAKGKLKYRGAIDNWAISLGQKRLEASEHYLSDALDNYLAGKPINPMETKPVGCYIE